MMLMSYKALLPLGTIISFLIKFKYIIFLLKKKHR